MKYFYKILILFCFPFGFYSQSVDSLSHKQIKATNSLFIEGEGNSYTFASLNYERIIFQAKIVRITVGTGFGISPLPKDAISPQRKYFAYGIPFSANLLLGKNKHYFEFGPGITYNKGTDVVFNPTGTYLGENLFFIPRVGYRYQRNNGGFIFRIGFTPLILLKDYSRFDLLFHFAKFAVPVFTPSAGISFGYSF